MVKRPSEGGWNGLGVNSQIRQRNRLKRQSEILKALGHPVRLQIIQALAECPWCVCKLASELGVRQPYLSQQLAYLRRAGVVSATKDGLRVEYTVDIANIEALLSAIRNAVTNDQPRIPRA